MLWVIATKCVKGNVHYPVQDIESFTLQWWRLQHYHFTATINMEILVYSVHYNSFGLFWHYVQSSPTIGQAYTMHMCNACRYSPWTKSMHGSYGTLYRSHYTAIYKPMVTVTYTLFLGPAFKQTSMEMQSCKFSGCWVNYYDKGNHVSNHHLPALYSDECSLLHLCTFYMYCYLGLA